MSDFVEQNIDRVIKQCNGGDEAITFLAIYSFIEGYFREKFPIIYYLPNFLPIQIIHQKYPEQLNQQN